MPRRNPCLRFGLVVVVAVALAGCPASNSDQKWARTITEGYLKNIFEGNPDAAAAYTVSDFKYKDADAVAVVQMLKGKTWQIATENMSPANDEAFFEGTWDAKPGRGTFVVRVVKKDGKWRVEEFTAHKD